MSRRSLRIAQIAPLWFTIPPKKYGGIERIASQITEGLVKRGHRVTLFAAPGSKTKARLVSVYPKTLIDAGIPWNNPLWNLQNLTACFEQAGRFDIIHSHLDLWTLFFQTLTKTPVLHTMHNQLYREPPKLSDRLKLFRHYKKSTNVVFISRAMRRISRVRFPHSWVIYNGVDPTQFPFSPRSSDTFLWVARINKFKGIENAIAAAERTHAKLWLAGRIDKTQREYFKTRIRPHLSSRIKYLGELTGRELARVYGEARAVLYPIEWNEPFGLIMAEAMACGTPVIAYPRGSVPEIVQHGKTGFVVKNVREMVRAMRRVDVIDRSACRAWVEKHFSVERMVDEYEKLYYALLKKA